MITEDIDLQPYATVRAGEVGTVVRIDPSGFTEIELDTEHRELRRHYDNRMWIIPPETSEVLSKLEVLGVDPSRCVGIIASRVAAVPEGVEAIHVPETQRATP
jgi:hypothetical protein